MEYSNGIQKYLLAMRKPIEDPDSPYSSRNSSKGALLTEAKILFSYLARGTSLDSARRSVFQDNIFEKKLIRHGRNAGIYCIRGTSFKRNIWNKYIP
jgi:hypothetical protein